jgi:superfamily II DNA/RNA helicase
MMRLPCAPRTRSAPAGAMRGRATTSPRPPAVLPAPARLRAAPAPAATPPSGAAGPASTPPPPTSIDTNALQTALHAAIAAEDWGAAAAARDALASAGEAAPPATWADLGAPSWLGDRAAELGFPYPTDVQRRAGGALAGGRDGLVVAATGSGKTLAFLIPLLGRLPYPPDPAGDPAALAGPLLTIIVPTRDLGVQTALLAYRLLGGSINGGRVPGASGNMFRYAGPRGIRVRGVLDDGEALAARVGGALAGAHVVVGTPDALLAATEPGAPPITAHARAVAVDEADACLDGEAGAGGGGGGGGGGEGGALDALMCATIAAAALDGRPKPQVVLVGATAGGGGHGHLNPAAVGTAHGWLAPGAALIVAGPGPHAEAVAAVVGGGGGGPNTAAPPPAIPPPPIPAGLSHRLVAAPPGEQLGVLCRLLRSDVEGADPDSPPPRAIVFVGDEKAAVAAAPALRAALWGAHTLAVLLPGGREPVAALHAFRDGAASLLLATPAAARGLDVPAVSHVYCVGAPASAADYIHRAGRAGRIGSTTSGGGGGGDPPFITTLASPGPEADDFCALLAGLGLEVTALEPPPPRTLAARPRLPSGDEGDGDGGERAPSSSAADADAARRELEDLFWTRAARGVPGEDLPEEAEVEVVGEEEEDEDEDDE